MPGLQRLSAFGQKSSVILLLGALTGCSGSSDTSALSFNWGGKDKPVVENIAPVDYRPKILDTLRSQLPDPTGIRDAYIAEPALKPLGPAVSRYIACLRFTAKNADGQYTPREMAAYYYAGQLTQIRDAERELCGSAAYQPFPELEKLCRSLNCKSG